MSKIAQAAETVVAGEFIPETKPWFCLKFVRQIVEKAFGWMSGEFYRRYHTHWVEENTERVEPWARDLERSMRNAGLAVHDIKAGDLVFNYQVAKPYGHVGVMLTDTLVLENTPSLRGFMGLGAWRISHIRQFGTPTTIIRIPEGE